MNYRQEAEYWERMTKVHEEQANVYSEWSLSNRAWAEIDKADACLKKAKHYRQLSMSPIGKGE